MCIRDSRSPGVGRPSASVPASRKGSVRRTPRSPATSSAQAVNDSGFRLSTGTGTTGLPSAPQGGSPAGSSYAGPWPIRVFGAPKPPASSSARYGAAEERCHR